MARNPVIPPLAPPPFRDPALLDGPAERNPLAPVVYPPFGGTWQRWFGQIFRAVGPLLGLSQSPVLDTGANQYRWKTALRLSIPQSELVTLAAILTASDDGLLVHVTDYNHVLEWSGPAHRFFFGPGDVGANYFVTSDAGHPNGINWIECLGQATDYLQPDGTITATTLPNTPDTWFRR